MNVRFFSNIDSLLQEISQEQNVQWAYQWLNKTGASWPVNLRVTESFQRSWLLLRYVLETRALLGFLHLRFPGWEDECFIITEMSASTKRHFSTFGRIPITHRRNAGNFFLFRIAASSYFPP